MSSALPEDRTYVVTNSAVIDAPLQFVWEHLPKSLDISKIMQPYRGLPGAKSWVTSPTFNEPASSITYTMTNDSTIVETIIKRDPSTHHYVYGYQPPGPVFAFWQGNIHYYPEGQNQTRIVWDYWIQPKGNPVAKVTARLVKRFIWKGYTRQGIANLKRETESLYRAAD